MAATAHGTAVEQDLLRTPVIAVGHHLTQHPGSSAPPVVVLETRRTAFFKRFRDQSPTICAHYQHDPYDVPLNEVVAWRLAEALGGVWRQLVPTSVLRKIEGHGGALMNHRLGTVDHAVFTDAPAQAGAAGFWDALVGNQDRNAGNYRYDASNRRLGVIDHGFCFARPGDPMNSALFLAARRRQNQHPITSAERSVLEALVHSDDLHGLRGFLAADRVQALENRAQRMLSTGCLPTPSTF